MAKRIKTFLIDALTWIVALAVFAFFIVWAVFS